METLKFLQLYWWALISLLGALLVFMMFVQGGQTLLYNVAKTEEQKQRVISLLGHKWEITFTTLVTFGGAAFASFPLFYSTSFSGAYWLWMLILFLFVIQAVSYEFRNKQSNLLGKNCYDVFLFLNGSLGTILLGVAVATLFSGGAYYMDKMNITDLSSNVISRWANGWMGLDAIANPFNILLGLVLFFGTRTLGTLYLLNSIESESDGQMKELSGRCNRSFKVSSILFVLLFVCFLVALLLRKGYGVDPSTGVISEVEYKYLFNMIELVWPLVILLAGVVLVLAGIGARLLGAKNSFLYRYGFYVTGFGTVLAVWPILICAAYNNTAYFPSLVSVQDSLTLYNSSSSLFTLKVMSYVSLAIPFVVAYIAVVWKKMSNHNNKY